MRAEFKLQGLDGVLHVLQQLPPEVAAKRGGPVLAALRKGAKVIRDQARINLDASIAAPGKTGVTVATGFTGRHVVSQRRPWREQGRGERVVVTVRDKNHPAGGRYKSGRRIRTADLARYFEYGSVTQAPLPWLVPAFKARAREAIAVIERETWAAVQRAVKKLARQRGGVR